MWLVWIGVAALVMFVLGGLDDARRHRAEEERARPQHPVHHVRHVRIPAQRTRPGGPR